MRRKLFFILEKLEIRRSERITISVLMILLVLLSCIWIIQEPKANYVEGQYRELEKVFKERSKKLKEERELILARYKPNREIPVSSSVTEEEAKVVAISEADTTEQDQAMELIDINTATNEQLQKLPGIGPAYASRIIEWRNENGNFVSKDQLQEIKGIGEKRLAKIKPLISL